MALSRLSDDGTEVLRRSTDRDFDFVAAWGAKFGISDPMNAFIWLRNYLVPKKDLDALNERLQGLYNLYQPHELNDFKAIDAVSFGPEEVVDAMGVPNNPFNRRVTKGFMKEGGKLNVLPGGKEHFVRLITDGTKKEEEPANE